MRNSTIKIESSKNSLNKTIEQRIQTHVIDAITHILDMDPDATTRRRLTGLIRDVSSNDLLWESMPWLQPGIAQTLRRNGEDMITAERRAEYIEGLVRAYQQHVIHIHVLDAVFGE